MYRIKLFPGDTALINGVEIQVDTTTTLSSTAVIERKPIPGLTDLPETPLRTRDLWHHTGHRAAMIYRQDLRCPCGSAYVRRSATHHSCQHCGRVWLNSDVEPGASKDNPPSTWGKAG